MLRQTPFQNRCFIGARAFSLVELLVVIAIIGLLVAILLVIILLLLEGVIFAVVGVPMMMFAGPHMAGHMGDHAAVHEAMLTFLKQPPQVILQTVGPVAIVCGLIGSMLIGAVSAIVYAPWAAAYRMLRPEA